MEGTPGGADGADRDLDNSRYAELDEIDAATVGRLAEQWSYNGPNLVAADAETGELVASYGDGGVLPVVGLALQAKYPDVYPPTLDPHTLGYRITSAPAYHDGTLYVGAALSEGPMTYQVNGRQYVTVVATNTVLTFALP